MDIYDFIINYDEVAESAHVQPADGEDGQRYILLTINGRKYCLTLDQAWRLGDKLREV